MFSLSFKNFFMGDIFMSPLFILKIRVTNVIFILILAIIEMHTHFFIDLLEPMNPGYIPGFIGIFL